MIFRFDLRKRPCPTQILLPIRQNDGLNIRRLEEQKGGLALSPNELRQQLQASVPYQFIVLC
ncbi:hypothetical protein VFPPC_18704 [Pochonia chlamydosporia 170]|uniref:Uncharacterized protein n=1 Tax=Pochonia chlamydosporia 170 TaxID=1380566 RepID=A0A219ASK8_METCM|nr:hypothetical protein VFPPC_18704 [Pochonia chlamydosporia 170]OWT43569.1 hypothetical protein VFPPC_18704 [Pochonia chlamydosporia 170]